MNTSSQAAAKKAPGKPGRPGNIVPLVSTPRIVPGVKPKTPTTARRQRFRILNFINASGTRSFRVQGAKRGGVYVRENFADERRAEERRLELETEYLGAQAAHLELPRITSLNPEQLRVCEVAVANLERAEADVGDLLHAVDRWLREGRAKAAGQSPRLDEAVTAFREWLDATPELREITKKGLRVRLNIFASSVGNLRLDAITAEVLEDYLSKRNVGPVTKDNDKRALSRFFSWCKERPRCWISKNPTRDISVAAGEKLPPAILTVDQCRNLMRAAEAHDGGRLVPYFAVCLFGGLRPHEALRLTWEQVNLADNEIRLEANQTKNGRARVVAIVPTIHGADGKRIPGPDTFRKWLASCKGRPFNPSNWRTDFRAVTQAAGFRGGPNSWTLDVMRHTAVSHFFRITHSYGQTAEQFGNSESIIKRHYQGRVSSDDTKAFYGILPKSSKH